MRLRRWMAVALVLAAACTPSDSGVEGQVTAGPVCPVVQAGIPCPDQPYAGTLTILTENGRVRIASVTANASGYYRVLLAPGAYVIHPESPGVLPRGADVIIVVRPHEFTYQDIVYDTGIR